MPTIENLTLRVNGRIYQRVGLQYELQKGFPSGPLQVVIKDDPSIPPFTLTEDFVTELKEEGRDWQRVSLAHLIALFESHAD